MIEREIIIQLDTTVDHLTGEEIGQALAALNDLPETLDSVYIPCLGKKNRPSGIIQTLCEPAHEEAVAMAVFRHTHTLGIRRQEIERLVLPREHIEVDMAGDTIKAKSYLLENETYIRPEADEIGRLACERGVGAPALRILHKK